MKISMLKVIMVIASTLFFLHSLVAQSFARQASVTKNPDGSLAIAANSPRPLWQALEAIRLRYGWTVDYEDPLYPQQFIRSNMSGRRMLIGGAFSPHFKEPKDNSMSEEKRVLSEIVDQYNAQSTIEYRVLLISDDRFDIAPASPSPMDQLVEIDSESRSLREEVDAIMAAFTKATGIRAVQGGLIDNGMEQQQVALRHAQEVPVRQLLNEVLDHSRVKKTWLFTYEPDGNYVGVGIRTTESWTTDPNGATVVTPRMNPHFAGPAGN